MVRPNHPLISLAFIVALVASQAGTLPATFETIPLPALQLKGQPARAHTQGLEVVEGKYYVTGRLEKGDRTKAWLLRTQPEATRWDVWDITPPLPESASSILDHPGGLQSDGQRLWIPVAESKRHGQTLIRVFSIARLVPERPAIPELEIPIDDHIGALAVDAATHQVFGANWDTETVYNWDTHGRLRRTVRGPELALRDLGVVTGPGGRFGLAVQDWKVIGNRLVASGMYPKFSTPEPLSALLIFTHFLGKDVDRQTIPLPIQERTELGREAMAISNGSIYFLPEDLGATNRLFRAALTNLTSLTIR